MLVVVEIYMNIITILVWCYLRSCAIVVSLNKLRVATLLLQLTAACIGGIPASSA